MNCKTHTLTTHWTLLMKHSHPPNLPQHYHTESAKCKRKIIQCPSQHGSPEPHQITYLPLPTDNEDNTTAHSVNCFLGRTNWNFKDTRFPSVRGSDSFLDERARPDGSGSPAGKVGGTTVIFVPLLLMDLFGQILLWWVIYY